MTDTFDTASGLAKKLANVMLAVDKVAKRGRNDFHKYDYATESDIVFAVREKLAEQHVVLIPSVTAFHRDPVGDKGSVLTTLEMKFTFIDGDTGEQIVSPWLGAGSDKEDKGIYKAMSGAEKYFLLKTFLIPTGDDPEAADSDGRTTRDQGERKRASRTTSQQVEAVRERLNGAPAMISEAQRTRLWTIAQKHGWTKEHIRAWLITLGYSSSKDIPASAYDDIVSGVEAGPQMDLATTLARAIEVQAQAAQQETH